MKSIEFDPSQPEEFENFISENEIKRRNIRLLIIGGISISAICLGIFILNQQTKNFKKKLKRDRSLS